MNTASLAELLASPQAAGVYTLVPERSGIAVFGRVDVRSASLRTGIGRRDDHLRSAEFFDVEPHPEISVVVTAPSGSPVRRRSTAVISGLTAT